MKLKKIIKNAEEQGLHIYEHNLADDIRFSANDEVFANMANISYNKNTWVGVFNTAHPYESGNMVYGSYKNVMKACIDYSLKEMKNKFK